MKNIQKLASYVNTYLHHYDSNKSLSVFFEEKAEDFVKENFPSGSGVDNGTKINWEKTRKDRIVLTAPFHHMDEHGFYCGWTDHEIIITPAFDGIDLKVTGRDKNGIKDYLADLFYETCTRLAIPPPSTEISIAL